MTDAAILEISENSSLRGQGHGANNACAMCHLHGAVIVSMRGARAGVLCEGALPVLCDKRELGQGRRHQVSREELGES